jgi:endoglucanase
MIRRPRLLFLAWLLVCMAQSQSARVTGTTVAPAQSVPVRGTALVFGVKVSGNQLLSMFDGSTVQLIGTSVSGLENGVSSPGWASFANTTLAFWQSLKNYNGSGINVIRLPLNSAYWLGYACGHSASTYQQVVEHVVSLASRAGLYVILDLHWDAPNVNGIAQCPIGQGSFAGADHAFDFWKSVAVKFKGNPAVIFELFNEPFGTDNPRQWVERKFLTLTVGTDGPYLANGGNYSPFVAQNNINGGDNKLKVINMTWPVAGEIQLLQAIRAEGATNVVLASPMGWASEIATWLSTYTTNGNPDPLKQLAASWHVYGYGRGPAGPLAVLAAGYPIVITETYGIDPNLKAGTATAAGYAWARSNHIGYLCWGVINDWGRQTLSLSATPPWEHCPAQ